MCALGGGYSSPTFDRRELNERRASVGFLFEPARTGPVARADLRPSVFASTSLTPTRSKSHTAFVARTGTPCMAIRNTHDKTRFESPRVKDIPNLTVGTESERTVGRGSDGRFAAGNRAANGRAQKTITLASMGDPKDPRTAQLASQARTLYFAYLRALPSDGPTVRSTIAAQARNTVLAAEYARLAAVAGLATKEGIKLSEQARAHDVTANRLAVTALDIATREANQKRSSKQPDWLAAIKALPAQTQPILAPAEPVSVEPEPK